MGEKKYTDTERLALIEYIKASIDIADYIGQYVELEEDGDQLRGKSPFKKGEDVTPSMKVNREKGVFYDFSVSEVEGGDVISFVQAYYHCGIDQAINILLEYLGESGEEVEIPQKLSATVVAREYNPKQEREKACTAKPLPDDYMSRFEKRDDKLEIWRAEGISDKSLEKFQVFYDPIDDRLVYPVRDTLGNIVNIGGRTLSPKYKELGLRKYCYYYKWGTINTIYGLAENREGIIRKQEIILFEGCKSVLLADTWGIPNTGAILTSHLSVNQMRILIKLGVDVVFALDKDVDVTTDKHVQKLKRFVNVYYLRDRDNLLDAKDAPVDKGREVFEALYSTARKLR